MSGTIMPDFVFNNNNLIHFTSLDALIEYAQTMLGKPMYGDTQTFTTWNDAFKRYFTDQAPIKHVNINGNEYWEIPEIQTEGNWVAQGEYATVSSGTSAAQAVNSNQAVGGGGVKSTPKVQTIVTDSSTGGATPGDTARGLKNFGIPTQNQIANLVDGVCKTLSIANLAINVQNLGIWRKLCNYVFDADLPEAVTVTDIYNLLFSTTETIVARDSQDRIITTVPESTVRKMYDFFKQHITVTGDTGDVETYLPDLIFSLVVWGAAPAPYTDRYLKCLTNVAPNTGVVYFGYTRPSDKLLQLHANDFTNFLIGCGFNVPNTVAESFIASMEGVLDRIFSYTSVSSLFGTMDNFKFIQVRFGFDRGATPPPKETPVALSELNILLNIYDVDLRIDTSQGSDKPRVQTYFATDAVAKYLKRGKTGNTDADYGYMPGLTYRDEPAGGYKSVAISISYPANVQTFGTPVVGTNYPDTVARLNGWCQNDTSSEVPASGINLVYYSNLGYHGTGAIYEFDEELSTGFVRRNWDTSSVLPHDNTTIDGVFPEWVGSVKTLSQTDINGNETQRGYIPVALPHGQANAERIVNEGGANTPSIFNSQRGNQEGVIDPNADINDINEEINRTVDRYNDSQYTPESAPEPLPATYPNPQYPTNPPVDTSGDSGDTPDPTTMVGVTASGMCSVYNPTKQELMNFSAWLWSPSFLDNFLKIFQNPMDAIIGLHIMYATPATTTPSNIICGYLDSGVAAKVVDQQFTEIDCGTVDVPEYYGNAIDYEPYVQVHCYLPFIGIVSLKPNDVIGKKLNIKYGVDALTGTCLAILTTKKGSSEITCYNFPGNCATQIPISGGSYAQMITGLAGFVASGIGAVATANPLMALGAGASLLNSHLDVGHSGAIGANAGAMGIRKPYLIITRKSAYEASGYGAFYGYPANKTVTLGSCKGYTRIKSVHVEIPRATANEKNEIEQLLKQGVIIN